jgi:NDP-sugar pyrophosphorylase family protein
VEEGRIVGLAMLQDFVERVRYDNPVCIMAGGFGKRLRPLTDEVPKPLLKVGGKPILQNLLENFIESGFHRFFISVHYKPEQIKNHFGQGERWNVDVQYLDEVEPLGTGGALGLIPEPLGELPLIVMNGDLLTQVDFARVLAFHHEQRATATICVREFEFEVPYGVVQTAGDCVSDIVEKPVHRFVINAGMYVLNPALVRRVPRNQPIDMPAFLRQNIRAGERVSYFPVHEQWLDIGRLSDFEKAQAEINQRLS